MIRGWLLAGFASLGVVAACCSAHAQQPPNGQAVLNQGLQARALTKSDTTVIIPTRGIFVGDATACNIAVVFFGDSAAVTLNNVQSGLVYPFSIIKLMSANTTCSAITALY